MELAATTDASKNTIAIAGRKFNKRKLNKMNIDFIYCTKIDFLSNHSTSSKYNSPHNHVTTIKLTRETANFTGFEIGPTNRYRLGDIHSAASTSSSDYFFQAA